MKIFADLWGRLFKKTRAKIAAVKKEPASCASAPLLREEIVDSRIRILGYRFSLSQADQSQDAELLLSTQIIKTGILKSVQQKMVVIPVNPRGFRLDKRLSASPGNLYFLIDVRKTDMPKDVLLSHMQILRGKGYKIALQGLSFSPEENGLLGSTDMLFIQIADYSPEDLQKLTRGLHVKYPALPFVAEGVQFWAEQRMCAVCGFDYYLGGFLLSPDEMEKEKKLDQSRVAAIEMLNLLRNEADASEISDAAKKDPVISFKLLKLANSPYAGLTTPVASISQAIMVLGHQQLYRWLMVSMFRIGKTRDRDGALLEVALTRARALETVPAQNLSKKTRDELFIVGLLSLFEALLSMPIQNILAMMSLPEPVREALLHGSGPYGHYLLLVQTIEKGPAERVGELADELGIPLKEFSSAYVNAFIWAQDALGIE